MLRLFVAILPPATVTAEIAELAAPISGVRWTPPENLHLTLRFIGERDSAAQSALEEALARVRVEPFILPVAGVGVFPSRGPAKVLWAGLGRAHTRLFQLRKQVDEALLSVDTGLDVHSFHPHFTLGRLGGECEAKAIAKFVGRHTTFEAPPFRVGDFHLMSSELPPGGAPLYRAVRTFALQK
jgi:2'-5' RNA ligase